MEKLLRSSFTSLLLATLFALAMFSPLGETQARAWTGSTIRIKADGSVDPPTAPLLTVDKVTYTLTSDLIISSGDGIIIEKDNVILDGKNHTVEGQGGGTVSGIKLVKRSGVTIKNIVVKGFYYGIYLADSSGVSVSASNLTSNWGYGIFLERSSGNTISGCSLSRNALFDVYLTLSSGNTVRGNVLIGNGLFTNTPGNSVEDNTINGKPLVYLEEKTGLTVADAGQVILIRCKDVIVENLNLSGSGFGVLLLHTSNSVIRGNVIARMGYYGVILFNSSHNVITGNLVSRSGEGVHLTAGSSKNVVTGNVISNNYHSNLFIFRSSDNVIAKNIISNGSYGIFLHYSSGNKIYLNDFVSNKRQVVATNCSNAWDDGTKGNYWSDYTGTDANNDGIWDKPYTIDLGNQDRYPLVQRQVVIYRVTASSPFGRATGSGWFVRGDEAVISLSMAFVDYGNRTRKVFSGWYEGNSKVSDRQNFSLIVDGPKNLVAVWDTAYEVAVITPYGSATGSGWYRRGEVVTVSVSPAQVWKDYFTTLVFESWRTDEGVVSASPTYTFTVEKPVTLTASWRSEVNILTPTLIAGIILALAAVSVLAAKKRKPPPPPP